MAEPKVLLNLTDFKIGDVINITRIFTANTKYGAKLMAESGNIRFFLPGRLNTLNAAQIEELNNVEPLNLKYLGPDNQNSHLVQFFSESSATNENENATNENKNAANYYNEFCLTF